MPYLAHVPSTVKLVIYSESGDESSKITNASPMPLKILLHPLKTSKTKASPALPSSSSSPSAPPPLTGSKLSTHTHPLPPIKSRIAHDSATSLACLKELWISWPRLNLECIREIMLKHSRGIWMIISGWGLS